MIKKIQPMVEKKIQPEVEAPSYKLQAPSFKQRLTMVQGSCRMYIERYIMNEGMENLREIEELESQPLNRIASALEEILRLVKEDQERSQKYMEERKDDNN